MQYSSYWNYINHCLSVLLSWEHIEIYKELEFHPLQLHLLEGKNDQQ